MPCFLPRAGLLNGTFSRSPVNTQRPEVLILLHLNFINFSNQVEGSEMGSVSREAASLCHVIYSVFSSPHPPNPLSLTLLALRPRQAPLLTPVLEMRLQYLNDYDNQSGDPEPRLRLIFLSRTKARGASGTGTGRCRLGSCWRFSPPQPQAAGWGSFLVAN